MARTRTEPHFRGVALARLDRAMRWCILRTRLAARRAARRGRPISTTNQRRMTRRRWAAWLEQERDKGSIVP